MNYFVYLPQELYSPLTSNFYHYGLQDYRHRRCRRRLCREGISEKLILRWTNHADLFRINGVGPQFAELLEKAGVDTVKEFRHRVAENLQPKLEEINAEFHICGRVPAASEVQKMIDQAKELEPKVTY